MLDHRGFSAWITSDDLELVEFEPRTNNNLHTVTCWIVGTVGKTFIVHWRDHGSLVDSASYIYFDGYKVSGQFLDGEGEELRRGIRVGEEEERPFVFSAIGATDPSGFGGKPPDKNVGSIVLEIRLIKRVEEREPNPIRPPPDVIRGLRQEGDVAIRYGDVRPAPMQKRTWKMEPFDPKAPGPYVTFIFRYRSKDWLLSQGIIGEDETICRIPDHPPASTLSVADLPPMEHSDEEGSPTPAPAKVSAPASPRTLHSPAPPDSPPAPAAASSFQALGLGPRPQAPTETGRVASSSSIRSFSGTWDPNMPNDDYEQWDEYRPDYRPEDLDDAIDNYY
ncbi:hypothetical protein L226DRAFT_609027 [Lentinus tigrinus ALCF2SS1-7]|uniref:DUF7918 domain-containing protein n=1 Tax=Lentinus tigrinus ALCF2SS1-6 TaxID=1328759 RepID=A0A5C2SRZ4_9APHY|nr:hypothetical protein L227DRAFT_597438 [Lentinus tigrinus ALCF2SS1-6]RPD80060.1 hypothetical protein L226DRAFT_609027 [Lentinus tigrinus ALCF2SS1-7]